MKRKPKGSTDMTARPLKSRSVHFLEELDATVALREQRLEATLQKAEAIESLHDRMLAKAARDGLAVERLQEQRRRLIAETGLPALFAAVDAAIERYEAVLAACELANAQPEPEAVRQELGEMLFPQGTTRMQAHALERLAEALHAYFWISPDDRHDQRVRACWMQTESLRQIP